MLCINSENTDPFFNLASEEYLLKQTEEDVFLLYRNIPTIVVGKHQNALAEINLPFVEKHSIRVARRISGGGTVFHDLGNLNFAFITSGREGELVNYRKFTLPIILAMGKMGLKVDLGKRNELLLGERKISGTASHVFKKRVLHHGTLLFSTDLDILSEALRLPSARFVDRAVQSIRSEVTNIRDHLHRDMDVTRFQELILSEILSSTLGSTRYAFSAGDRNAISDLCDLKFSTWEWNFGYSPKYQFRRNLSFRKGTVELQLQVEKGIIRSIAIAGDALSVSQVSELEEMVVGSKHDLRSLRSRIGGIRVGDYVSGLENEEFLAAFF